MDESPSKRRPPGLYGFNNPWPDIPDVYAVGTGILRTAGTLAMHTHPAHMEICYIAAGRLVWRVGDEVHSLSGGEAYITWPDEIHGGVDNVLHPGRIYWLILKLPRRYVRGWLKLPPDEGRRLHSLLMNMPRRRFHARDVTGFLFDRLLDFAEAGAGTLNETAARATLISLLIETAVTSARRTAEPQHSPQVQQAIKVMEANLTEPLNLDQIAEWINWSLSHFKTRFRKETGESPAQYYLQRRVVAAVGEISKTNRPLVQIAQRFGFPSSQYLATCIKRITGRTPSSYRKD